MVEADIEIDNAGTRDRLPGPGRAVREALPDGELYDFAADAGPVPGFRRASGRDRRA